MATQIFGTTTFNQQMARSMKIFTCLNKFILENINTSSTVRFVGVTFLSENGMDISKRNSWKLSHEDDNRYGPSAMTVLRVKEGRGKE